MRLNLAPVRAHRESDCIEHSGLAAAGDQAADSVIADTNAAVSNLYALMVRMRQESKADNRAVYTAIGINLEGEKSVLGLWVSGTEGAKYWMTVLTSLKNRGMKDAFIICTDGLKGFPEAI